MSNLFNILDHIDFKGDKKNILIKFIISIAISAIVLAFTLGVLKNKRDFRIDNLEVKVDNNYDAIKNLEKKSSEQFNVIDGKIDKIYDDGMNSFDDYRKFNNEQLKLIIDYSDQNKELLKAMLDINSMSKKNEIDSELDKNRRESDNKVQKSVFINLDTDQKTYVINKAPSNYLDTLDLCKYKILKKYPSEENPELYNFEYRKIK